VAAIDIPDHKWGEVPKAFVTMRVWRVRDHRRADRLCRERLARFKCPQAIEFGPLPKTSTGKIQEFVLRDREWAGYDKRIH